MKTTPLHDFHVESGARMIEFAGWEMPVQYRSISEEHLTVRNAAGMFDVSHMGDVIIRREKAEDLLRRLLTNDVKDMPVGQALYSHILDEEGRIMDDTIVTRILDGEYLVVPNASTTPKILSWIRQHADGQEIVDASDRLSCIALQGPRAQEILQKMTVYDLSTMKRFTGDFVDLSIGENPIPIIPHDFEPQGFLTDVFAFELMQKSTAPPKTHLEFAEKCYISRTGYTGEDGFEILLENASAKVLWNILLYIGRDRGLVPVGLGARDTLRLEMGYLLSGTDFDGTQTSLQTGPAWVIKWDHDFIGRTALLEQKQRSDYQRLAGVEILEKGIPRHGYAIMKNAEEVGRITSGTMSPSLKKGIGLGYIGPPYDAIGTD
ncbi:MAG: glycine cleavage system protein T, partial [Methanomassiliicoccales archaeon]|nr:glycine cleavage system protein T [Methanomassiliicoccales archaeon]